jgi:hypothetical protein
MNIVVRCACGKHVRIDLDLIHRKPQCPHCKRPIRVSFWQRLRTRIKALFSDTASTDPRSETVVRPQTSAADYHSTSVALPQATPEVERLLQELGERAWRKESHYPAGNFLLAPATLVQGSSTQGMETNLKALYEHARRWAPGLTVPYKVPKVRLSGMLPHAGQYRVGSDGWVSIDISADFASRAQALYVVLAHEACHHILDLSGLDDKRDPVRTERLTDLTMFIAGFGDIVKAGRTSAMQTPTGYVTTHLGYLEAHDYDFAYTWVLGARAANGLPSLPSNRSLGLPSARRLDLPDQVERFNRELKGRIRDAEVRQRLIKSYQAKYPQESEDQIITRILDDYERDNR